MMASEAVLRRREEDCCPGSIKFGIVTKGVSIRDPHVSMLCHIECRQRGFHHSGADIRCRRTTRRTRSICGTVRPGLVMR